MIYDIDGTALAEAYDIDGDALAQAYDIDGTPLIDDSNELTVMTYNVQWFSGLNANETMQDTIIDTYQADIIGLQELHTSMPDIGTRVLSDYPYIYLGVQTNKTGIASKRTLSNATASTFSNQSGETRGYQKAYFNWNGHTVCWVNAHLATSDAETAKVAQAGELYAMVQNEEYFIITGDFNTVCKSVNDTEYTTIMKQFVDAGYNCANCTAQHGFIDTWTSGSTESGTWYPCDHIITSANISIDEVIADTTKVTYASQTSQSIDHIPLIAHLTIGGDS